MAADGHGHGPSGTSIVGVVVGAVLLFAAMSFIPLIILLYHRRTRPLRRDSELRTFTSSGTMRQVSVQRWLEEQTHPHPDSTPLTTTTSNNNEWHYAQESCPICLSHLSTSSSQDSLPYPEPACVAPSSSPPDESVPQEDRPVPPPAPAAQRNSILVLNRCHHTFHTECLAEWFVARRLRCPVCQMSYFPDD
ncbi:hypothetical protein BO71DRAFT_489257 [Aspergillus ellipticus CBS 707.79]|uniref:RING-type domain-containing protein n=1 Tax=Aspergillus ellipticus CBS 707.79 TaxID=1448320 RepID=A0A319CR54_9EURO|nr:hypothetical protein BO71DRAFT_489257 [Aspergillus ellipticus CBS 707.79]